MQDMHASIRHKKVCFPLQKKPTILYYNYVFHNFPHIFSYQDFMPPPRSLPHQSSGLAGLESAVPKPKIIFSKLEYTEYTNEKLWIQISFLAECCLLLRDDQPSPSIA